MIQNNNKPGPALEELIKKTFCNSDVAESIVGCSYAQYDFCQKCCGYSKEKYLLEKKQELMKVMSELGIPDADISEIIIDTETYMRIKLTELEREGGENHG